MDQIPETALAWHSAGQGAALATVVETWGSAPRPIGAQLAIAGDGRLEGSVSGGCVEGAVVVAALDALRDGICRVLEFGVTDDDAFAVGLACGGRIRVMVEPVGVGRGIDPALLGSLVAARAARRAVALVTDTESWDRTLADPATAPDRFRTDVSGFEGATRFLAVHNPPLRLAVVGGAHIAQSLARMAIETGYDVTVIDPRESFASPARFPGVALSHDWPDTALAALALDARAAVVTLTHDPKLDDPGLRAALDSPAFYIGALGSTRTHAKRLARLAAEGVAPDQIARIRAPVGLDIGARTPAEIAVAILAQITQALRRPPAAP